MRNRLQTCKGYVSGFAFEFLIWDQLLSESEQRRCGIEAQLIALEIELSTMRAHFSIAEEPHADVVGTLSRFSHTSSLLLTSSTRAEQLKAEVLQLRSELQRLCERDATADVHAAAVEREAVEQRGLFFCCFVSCLIRSCSCCLAVRYQ